MELVETEPIPATWSLIQVLNNYAEALQGHAILVNCDPLSPLTEERVLSRSEFVYVPRKLLDEHNIKVRDWKVSWYPLLDLTNMQKVTNLLDEVSEHDQGLHYAVFAGCRFLGHTLLGIVVSRSRFEELFP